MPFNHRTPLACAIVLAGLAGLARAENVTSNLQINGFATAGVSWVTEDFGSQYLGGAYSPGSGIDEQGSYQHDSVLGIQLNYALNEKFDLVGQLVSTARDNFKTEAEWAYLAYRLNDNVRLRAGRFAAPWYMYTENVRVGQAYPWARLPVELYNGLPIGTLNGFDLLYRHSLGDWNFDAQVTLGGSRNDYLVVKNNRGVNFNLGTGGFNFHAGYSEADLGINIAKNPNGNGTEQLAYLMNQYGVDLNQKGEPATFADIGMTYDDGAWMAAAELGQLRLDGFANNFDAGYVSVGHYFGKWLPYALASKINLVNKDQCTGKLAPVVPNATALATQAGAAATAAANEAGDAAAAAAQAGATYAADPTPANFAAYQDAVDAATVAAALAASIGSQAGQAATGAALAAQGAYALCNTNEQTSYSLGFRYDATKNVSLKLQVDHVRDFNGTKGYFSSAFPGPDDDTQVVTFNINAAF